MLFFVLNKKISLHVFFISFSLSYQYKSYFIQKIKFSYVFFRCFAHFMHISSFPSNFFLCQLLFFLDNLIIYILFIILFLVVEKRKKNLVLYVNKPDWVLCTKKKKKNFYFYFLNRWHFNVLFMEKRKGRRKKV